ncbi:MAG: SEC-C domain-containing protein [Deltaproteobacteria bacterium]|nr:SEC-C domain-containing protein [Deltaproteobacteria bacterium]
MAKIGRNAPCPCGSGKKYKKCCLPLHTMSSPQQDSGTDDSMSGFDDLDNLSNSVVDLIKERRLEEAEKVCHELLSRYPDQIDGIDRLAEVYEARGNNKKAAQYYRKAAAFAKSNSGFDQEAVDWYLSKANRLESENNME